MFNLKKNTAIWLLALLTLLIFSTTACGKKQPKPMLQSKEEKVPEKLKSMQEKSEKVTDEIEKIVEEMKKPEKLEETEKKEEKGKETKGKEEGKGTKGKEEVKEKEKDKGKDEGKGEDKDSSSGEEKKSKEDQKKTSEGKMGEEEKKPLTKQEKVEEMWKGVKKTTEEIHTSWGDYEIKAIENGAKKPELSKFEDTINNLTVAVEEKNILNSLTHSNEITYNMATFYDSYKGNHEGELMRLRYFARQAHLYGMKGEWDKSEGSIKQAEETMNMIRAKIKLDKKDQDLMEKLNLSIINMRTAIPKKNIELMKIKRDIVLKNIDQIKSKLR